MLKGRGLLDYTNLCSPNEYDKNDNIKILSINQNEKFILWIDYKKRSDEKVYCSKSNKYRKLKKSKIFIFEKKHFFLLFAVSVAIKMKNI